MLDPEFLGDLPDTVVDMWHAVETDLLCDIAKRINNSNYLIPTSTWNLNKLKDLGLHQDYINEKLSQATKKSKEEIEKIMANAFREGLRHDNEIIKRGLGKLDDIVINAKAFNPIASAGIKAVNNEIRNFTKTYAARLSQKYEWSIDKAFLNVQSGYMTPEQATKRAIEELFLHNDLPDLVTQKGRHEQLSTVVARAIRTGTNQSMAKIQIENCKDLDCDLVEVSSHYGARPTHAEWQGQIYSLSGKHDKYADFVKSTGYGGVDGLCGINCRHSFYPYFEGLSTKSFERIDPKENQKYFELKGKEKTLKNRIKHLTKKAKVLKAGGVDNGIVKQKLRKAQLEKFKTQSELSLIDALVGENYEYAKDFFEIQKTCGICTDDIYNFISRRNDGESGYIQTYNAFKINENLRFETLHELNSDDIKVIELLDKVIQNNKTPVNLLVYRWDNFEWLEDYLGKLSEGKNDKNVIRVLNDNKGHIDVNLGYTSASLIEGKNFFSNRRVKRIIKIPKGTNAFITRNVDESEIILGRGTKTMLENAEIKSDDNGSYVEIVLKLIKE